MKLFFACIFIPAIFLAVIPQSQAQDIYRTKNGTLMITLMDRVETVKFHTNTLQINLNLKTAEFDFSLPLNSLHSTVDSLNQPLKRNENDVMRFKGILNLDEIRTEPHEPYIFKFNADLEYNDIRKTVEGIGRLEHIPGREQPACQLSLSFDIKDFELIDGMKDNFRFQLIQSILYQSGIN